MGSAPPSVRVLSAFAGLLLAGQLLHVLGAWPDGAGDAIWDGAAATLIPFAAFLSVFVRALSIRGRHWWFAAAGVGAWATGNLLWTYSFQHGSETPDLFLFLAFYPCMLVFLALELRERCPRLPVGLWIDGVAGVLAIAAIGFGVVLPLLMPGGADDVGQLSFPVIDIALIALIVAMFTIARWQPGRDWLVWGLALAVLAAGDLLWLGEGAGSPSSLGALLWSAAMLAVVAAPWQRSRAIPPATMTVAGRLTWPFVLFLASLAIVVAGNFLELWPAGLWLAVAAILVASYRALDSYVQMRDMPETQRLARTDELTGLSNRRGFLDALRTQLQRHPDRPAAVLMLDLDRFKELNDTLGHQAGDRLLSQLGPRLSSALRPADTLARLGGDEFAVLCPGAGAAGARQVAKRLQDALDQSFSLGDLALHVDASVGIAVHPDDGSTVEELLQRADVAMYLAKGTGAQVVQYDASRDEHSRDKLALVGELRRALEHTDELVLHYQPQADLADGRIVAVEALIRWQHPTRGLLAPGAFLGALEGAGMMRRLGRYVLREAVAQAARWRDLGFELPVAVNLSTADLVDGGLAREVEALLTAHGLDGTSLKMEVTENTVMAQPERVMTTLRELRELGCRVSLDDFGTGHASLAHLVRLPVDELKIDRSFVQALKDDAGSAAIVRSVALLGRDLRMTVVAEGVETVPTWSHLAEAGCTVAQGYLLSRALPAADLEAWLNGRDGDELPVAA
jgi:diguanylate cyclase (GGDEF)-like protein